MGAAAVPVRVLAACSAGLLSGCGPSQDATPAQPPPPADAPAGDAVDVARPLNALGEDPFWSLKIRADGLTFSAPPAPDLTAANPGPRATPGAATWTAGKPLRVTVQAAVCQDPGSGVSYPFTATVETGGRTLSGCAAYADAMPRTGG